MSRKSSSQRSAERLTLTDRDLTVFAKCSGLCARRGRGASVLRYFGKAYSERRWRTSPVCDNCGSPMAELHRVQVEA